MTPTTSTLFGPLLGVPLGLTLALACGPRLAGESPHRPGAAAACPDGSTRPVIDCRTDLGLRERVVSANASLGRTGIGIGGQYEERAKGQVTDSTYQLALKLESLCKDYNACAIGAEQYGTHAQRIREQLTSHVAMVATIDGGSVTPEAGDQLWRNAVPDLAAARLELDVRVEAQPKGATSTILHQDGAPLRSGDSMRVVVRASVPAYVYVLLLASDGGASVLFPNPDMALVNPLVAQREIAIPNDGAFVLDDVRGDEHLQVLASPVPLGDLEARMAALAARVGKPGKPARPEAGVLGSIGAMLCDDGATRGIEYRKSSASCDGATTRGIVYRKDGGAPRLAARPNDDVIVYQHEIDHR
jgi:hypothetical protein